MLCGWVYTSPCCSDRILTTTELPSKRSKLFSIYSSVSPSPYSLWREFGSLVYLAQFHSQLTAKCGSFFPDGNDWQTILDIPVVTVGPGMNLLMRMNFFSLGGGNNFLAKAAFKLHLPLGHPHVFTWPQLLHVLRLPTRWQKLANARPETMKLYKRRRKEKNKECSEQVGVATAGKDVITIVQNGFVQEKSPFYVYCNSDSVFSQWHMEFGTSSWTYFVLIWSDSFDIVLGKGWMEKQRNPVHVL